LELKETADGKYKILLKIRDTELTASEGEILAIPTRPVRARQDWLQFPVGGVSFEDATAYAGWLSSSGQLPGARICTEQEWERATRGADDRIYPHGDRLEPEDANFDETYGKVPASFGPDVVGSHPLSRSPFGVDDLAGNHFEWTLSTLSKDEPVVRSSSYLQDSLTQYSINRNLLDPTTKLADVGIRICASPLHSR
jgi:formylglycine-generating enzyme required for sulfatase activity